MSVFDAKSRYVKHAAVTTAVDRRGRDVACVTPASTAMVFMVTPTLIV